MVLGSTGDRVAVLVAAGGAAWESDALRALGAPDLGVVRRCVDVADLLATAATGTADVAVVAGDLPGLDATAVQELLRHDVRTLAVTSDPTLTRLGLVAVVAPPDEDAGERPEAGGPGVPPPRWSALGDAARAAAARDLVPDPDPDPGVPVPSAEPGPDGRLVAVWGPAGSPGRTTVAVGIAAELAHRGRRTVLADLDPYGGAVAQQLGVLDEVSGLLAAARLVNAGQLDQRRFAGTRRVVGDGLEVLTGLPRADRWVEVRDRVVPEVLCLAVGVGRVVADTGFCLEDDPGFGRSGPGRNQMTLDALAEAEHVVVVGSADPVGLSRLARGLVELGDAVPGVRTTVVVNRMRESLGWVEDDIRGMVEGFARPVATCFLPDDRAACDRALVEGRSLTETGDSPLRRAVAALVDVTFPETVAEPAPRRRLPGRRAGRVRR